MTLLLSVIEEVVLEDISYEINARKEKTAARVEDIHTTLCLHVYTDHIAHVNAHLNIRTRRGNRQRSTPAIQPVTTLTLGHCYPSLIDPWVKITKVNITN
ncbi:hypothetical protein AB6A40_000447 [Gnathostoma spinigerum]|uniref:Uncharacterized protein n=1 Tax=Gnathostoma spinigerum TaxID=75299 RepID=A0ABD6EAG9_9BILA